MSSKVVLILTALVLLSTGIFFAKTAHAFPFYSRPSTGEGWCKGCHGDFRDDEYISRTDGTNWGNLHDLHRNIMLQGPGYPDRCETCHYTFDPGPKKPVFTFKSRGNDVLDPISCMGCHGRYEDRHDEHEHVNVNADNGIDTHGMGAGLRQHHWTAGITFCAGCHEDADPEDFTTAGEDAQPPYYFSPDPVFYNKPTDACNLNGDEDYAGILFGLDNDGDGLYDALDPDCTPPSGKVTVCHFPPGNPDKNRTLSIYVDSLIDHAEHGDLMGPCDG